MAIEIVNLTKYYEGRPVLRNFQAVIQDKETVGIMGPSGEGKTTLLRILMGLEKPDAGSIIGLEGRRISAVFQEDRLCEPLSVLTNIRMMCPGRTAREEILEHLKQVGLEGQEEKKAALLSGGMSRRTAIVRAVVTKPDILLLDEPFKGLDAQTKSKVVSYVKKYTLDSTIVMVTHDQGEAEAMHARMITLNAGKG